ncbi:hypothetical protein [Paenibacillus tundrae]|nr:hypothetical protein [Paenibacillus tundrae]
MSENSEGRRLCRIFVPSQEIFRWRAGARQGKLTQAGAEKVVKDALH